MNAKLKRLTVVLFGVAILAGTGAAVGAKVYIEDSIARYREQLDSQYHPIKVAVAATDVPAGTPLSAQNVVARSVPREFLHRDAIPVAQWKRFNGRRARAALTAGAPILQAQLLSERPAGLAEALEQGKRALTVAVDQISSISGMLAPGDRIDMLLTLQRQGSPVTFPLMKDLPVLATGVRTAARIESRTDAPDNRYNTVTLLVGPEQAAKIVHAREVGTLTVVLRAENDASDGWPGKITLSSLLGEPPAPKPRVRRVRVARQVEVIRGGQGASQQ